MRTWLIPMLGLAVLAGCGETKEQRATTGAVGGGTAGAVVGGPVGAVAGAGVGALAGANREKVDEGTDRATDATRQQLAQAKDRSGEQPTTARSAERMSGPALTNEEVKEAQTVLRDLGLYDGEVDGIYGRKTMAAVGKFQEQNDLPRTNSLNAQTREKLQQQASSAGGATGGTTGGTTGGDTGGATGGKRVSPQAPSGQGAPGGQPGVQPEAPPSPQQPRRSQ